MTSRDPTCWVSVRTGTRVNDLQVVEDGLTGKDWVVTKGVQKAVPGRRVTVEKQDLPASATTPAPSSGPGKGGP
jgi:multidrug efflux system membrane fusion protein